MLTTAPVSVPAKLSTVDFPRMVIYAILLTIFYFYLFLPIFIFILPSRNKGNREFVAINRVQSSSFKKTNEYVKRHTLKTFHRERSSRRVERNEADR